MIKIIFYFLAIASYSKGFFLNNDEFKDYYCKEIEKPFFKIVKEIGKDYVINNRMESYKFNFPLLKSKKKRIFIIGESVAAILYDNFKDRNEPFNRQDEFEIFDFGMNGYDSYRIKGVFKEAVELNPDGIIIMSGNNEFLNEPCEGIDGEIKRRYVNLISNLGKIFSNEREKLFQLSLKIQRDNIIEMIEMGKKKGVKVFIATLPSNLFMPPGDSRPYLENYIKGYIEFDRENYDKSYEIFKKIIDKSPDEPFANYYLGISLYKLNKTVEAKPYLEKAAEYSNIDRTTTRRNEMLSELSKEYGTELIDLNGYFKNISKQEIIKENFFADGVHWYRDYNLEVQSFMLENLYSSFQISNKKSKKKWRLDNTDKKAVLLSYILSNITQDQKNPRINERIIYFLNRLIEINKGTLPSFKEMKKILESNDNSYLNEVIDKNSNDLLSYSAEAFRRRNEIKKALELLSYISDRDINEKAVFVYSLCHMQAKDLYRLKYILNKYRNKISDINILKKYLLAYGYDIEIEKDIKSISEEDKHHSQEDMEKDELKNKKAKSFSDSALEKLYKKDIEGAIYDLNKALEIQPYHFEALMNISYAFYLKKDYDKAIMYLNRIIENPPNNPEFNLCHVRLTRLENYRILNNKPKLKEDYDWLLNNCAKDEDIKKRLKDFKF
jgi:tetratricopeptide (TPR) repeat protein